jgi:AAA15 family ATPase/GTPase
MTALSLTQVGIDGFRGLRLLDLDGLGRINILVGGNNSGKTSVLEALSILCQPYNPNEWLSMVRRRDFGQLDETRIQSLRWCFTHATRLTDPEQLMEAKCEFKCQGEFQLRGICVEYSEFIGEPSHEELKRSFKYRLRKTQHQPDIFSSDESPFEDKMRGMELLHSIDWPNLSDQISSKDTNYYDLKTPVLRVWEKVPDIIKKFRNGPKLESETLTPYSYQINRNQVRSQSKRIFQQDSPSVLELLRDFDPNINGIDLASFSGERAAVYIDHSKLGVAPLSIFGDATRRAVLLAATLLSLKDGGVLLIDEVEAGIHVNALARVFEWLVKTARILNVQVFVTTHSLEAVDALITAQSAHEENDVVAFHLDQTADKTLCKRFSGDLLQRLRFERGLDVR